MGSAPVSSLSGNPGHGANALSQVHAATQMLQAALPQLPIGTPAHDAVYDAIGKLRKVAPASEAIPGVQATQLRDLQQQAQQQQPFQALMRSAGAGAGQPGGGGGPGGPPQMPPMLGGAG